MNEIALCFLVAGLLLVFFVAAISARKKESEKREAGKAKKLQVLRSEILENAEKYNDRIRSWKKFYAKYEHLGEPTTYIGFSTLHSGAPWQRPMLEVEFDDSTKDIDTLIKWAYDTLETIDMKNRILPEIYQTAMFFEEARVAVLGYFEYKPEQLRFIKSRMNKADNEIVVTITTIDLSSPIQTMDFPLDDRDTVDELKTAFNAFKMLK